MPSTKSAIASAIIPGPFGELTLVATSTHLVGVYLPAQQPPDVPRGSSALLDAAARQLAAYLAGDREAFDLPLAPAGTAFQLRVWEALRAIPYGATCSYGALADAIGRGPAASRAVGMANGKNPLAIVVPCHRVIGASGALTGYAGGLDAKRWLLAHEAATVQRCRPGSSSASSAPGSRSSSAAAR